jgi:hypothetical protein
MPNYSILINTCDKFEDCWDPFFKLFYKYWPDFDGKIYLNTEYKDYSYKGLNIIAVKGCETYLDSHSITWSECLIRALNLIDDDIILYMQEDYFLKDVVSDEIISGFVKLMHDQIDIQCVHLTDQAIITNSLTSKYDKLHLAIPTQKYLICCQAALWRKDVLHSYLRKDESAWEFEEFGSKRAANNKPGFYGVDKKWVKHNSYEIIPYLFTGVVQGRWIREVVPLFKKHNISMDFSLRGFLDDAPKQSFKIRLQKKFTRLPKLLKHRIEMMKLKLNP